ncbi:MAG: metallophosphoesterase [Phycisphaerae bacterium]|jgi:hypothetical protein
MMDEHLVTFVQVSDLHIGEIDPTSRSSRLDALDPRHYRLCKFFRGLLGHHYRALEHLSDFYERLKEQEDAQLIVSGDLTSYGHADQFAASQDFLEDGLKYWRGNVCLRVPDWDRYTVPGNHDHWPGRPTVFGRPPAALAQTVHPTSFVTPFQLSGGLCLRLIGINTDSEVRPFGYWRLLAIGSFADQLAEAQQDLAAPVDGEIRVMLLHHSRLYGGRRYMRPLMMCEQSRHLLDQFLAAEDVRVLLCGHVHAPSVRQYAAQSPAGQSVPVLECRCGTTMQRDEAPLQWKKWCKWTFEPNTLLVHRLHRGDGHIVWKTESYLRGNRGFKLHVEYQPPFLVPYS